MNMYNIKMLQSIDDGEWIVNEEDSFLFKDKEKNVIIPIEQNKIRFDVNNRPYWEDSKVPVDVIKVKGVTTKNEYTINEPEESEKEEIIELHLEDSGDYAYWDHKATLSLIAAVESRFEDMYHPKKRKTFWNEVSEDMMSQSYNFNNKRCKKKWDNLIRTYKNVKSAAKKTGRRPTRFMYFEKLDEILGDKTDHSSPSFLDTEEVEEATSSTQNVITIMEADVDENDDIKVSKDSADDSHWDDKATLSLIAIVESRFEDMYHPKKKKIFWNVVNEDMMSQSYNYDVKKCKKKWDNLLRTYKNIKDKAKKTGQGPTRFRFFQRLDEMLADKMKHCIPHFLDIKTIEATSSTQNISFIEACVDENNDTNVLKDNKRKCNSINEYVNIKKAYYEEKKAYLKKKLQLEERKILALEALVKEK